MSKVGLAEVGFGRLIGRRGRAYGHDIITDKDGVTRYCNDLTEVANATLRPCGKCGGDPNAFGGHDPCLANLPGVRNACCGHGVDEPYIEFEDGRIVIGQFKIARRT